MPDYVAINVAAYRGELNTLQAPLKGSRPAWDALVEEHNLQRKPLRRFASAWHSDLDPDGG